MKANDTLISHSSDRRVNGAESAMAHLYALPAELASPVARGYLSRTEALSAMLASTTGAERRGELAPYLGADVFRLQRHLFFQHLDQLETKRAITEGRVRRRIKPLIALRKPSNVLLAEAHDVNGAAGFPLEEAEVTDLAITEMYSALPPGQGGHRHAR